MFSRRSLIAVSLMAVLAASVAGAAQQQQAMSQQEMMDRMMKYATPTKAHDFLKNYVGKWDVEVKTFPQPGAQPMLSKGSMTGELILGGRFAVCHFQGQMMEAPFSGMQLMGYDLFQNKYAGIWIDSMSTCFYPTTGTLDASGKILTETGMWPDPMTGGAQKVKIVTTMMGPGKYRWEMFMPGPDGKEFMSMAIMYTKAM
jgi:hypothetical protein